MRIADLSPRERQIVRLASEGWIDKEIAAQLEITEGTVGGTLRTIYLKAGIGTRVEMIRHFYELTEKQ